MILDVHCHTFPDKIASQALTKMSADARILYFAEGTLSSLIRSTERSGIDYSVNLPVATAERQVYKINRMMVENLEYMKANKVLTFGCIHPDYTNYKEELIFLHDNGIRGIKIHPAYQGYDFNHPKFLRIMEFACALDMTIITHAGIDIGIPEHNYTDIHHIEDVLNTIAPKKLILAHMGQCFEWDIFRRELAGAPVYIDTAYSCGKIARRPDLPEPFMSERLSGSALADLCRAHGTDKVIFGTDSPWEDQKIYLDRIISSGLTEAELTAILGENLLSLNAFDL